MTSAFQEIWDLLGRRPFQPFRVVLVTGEELDVVRIAQAAISERLFLFGTPADRIRRIKLDQLDHVVLHATISSMGNAEHIYELLGRRPFQPFRIVLLTGEALDVVRTAQAVVSPRQLIYGDIANDRFQWVELDQIDRIEPMDLSKAAS